jgi:hypothetical protein
MITGVLQFALLIAIVALIFSVVLFKINKAEVQLSLFKGFLIGVASNEIKVEVKGDEVPVDVIQFSIMFFMVTVLWKKN